VRIDCPFLVAAAAHQRAEERLGDGDQPTNCRQMQNVTTALPKKLCMTGGNET
jgi:hypothetical protein